MPDDRFMTDEYSGGSPGEQESLDVVQRVIVSLLVSIVVGLIAVALDLYLILGDDPALSYSDHIVLWIMSGVIGLVASSVILLVNRRRFYHPLVVLGLLPMAVTGLWLFGVV